MGDRPVPAAIPDDSHLCLTCKTRIPQLAIDAIGDRMRYCNQCSSRYFDECRRNRGWYKHERIIREMREAGRGG